MKVGDLVTAGDPSSAPGIVVNTDMPLPWEVLVLWPEEEYGLQAEHRGMLTAVTESVG